MHTIKDKSLIKTNAATLINVVIYSLLICTAGISEGNEIQKAIEARKQGHYLKAIEYLLQRISKDPESVEANVELGTNYSKKGELDQAVRYYQRAIELNPKSLSAHYNLGVVFARKKLFEDAKTEYQTAIELDPSQSLPYYQLGLVFEQTAQFQRAASEYLQAIQRDPDNTSAYYRAATTYYRLGNQAQGDRYLKKFQFMKAQSRYETAETALKKRDIQEAIKQYQRAIDMASDFAPAYARLGAIAFQRKDRTKAMSYYQSYVELKPDSIKAHRMLGSIALQSNEFETAKTEFEKVIATEANNPYPFYGLGTACLRLAQHKDGVKHLKKSLQIDPDFAPSCQVLASHYLQHDQNFNEAYELAKHAVVCAKPSEPIASYWNTLAFAMYKLQNYTNALQAIGEALKIQPHQSEYLDNRKRITNAIQNKNR